MNSYKAVSSVYRDTQLTTPESVICFTGAAKLFCSKFVFVESTLPSNLKCSKISSMKPQGSLLQRIILRLQMDTAGNLTCCKWVNTLCDYQATALSKYDVLNSHYSQCFFLDRWKEQKQFINICVFYVEFSFTPPDLFLFCYWLL